MDAVFIVNDHTVLGKGLTLFLDLLIKPGSDDLEEPGEFRAVFDLPDKLGDLLDWEIDMLG